MKSSMNASFSFVDNVVGTNDKFNQCAIKREGLLETLVPFLKNSIHLRGVKSLKQPF